MVHWRNIAFLRLYFLVIRIDFFGFPGVFRYFFQGINVFVIHTAIEGFIKGLYYHDFCAFPVMNRKPFGIQHAVMATLELDAVAAVYGPFVQDSQYQVDFFIFRLRFKYGFDTIKGQ